MVCWHSRYTLGHKQPKDSPQEWIEGQLNATDNQGEGEDEAQDDRTVGQLLAEFEKDNLVLPLFLYDHSGISISTRSFNGRAQHAEWDSGQVGFVYVSHKKILDEYGGKRIGPRILARAQKALTAEVGTYNDYLTGMVFGYSIEGPDGVESEAEGESCYGYFGYPEGVDQALDEAKGTVDYAAGKIEAQAQEKATALVHQAQADEGMSYDTESPVSWVGDPNWERRADALAELAGWIHDRLRGRNRLHKQSVTKRLRKALGYSYP